MKNKGISLITLVITIVVVIILAAAVILTIGNNNPIANAKNARDKQSIKNIEEEYNIYISSMYAKTQGTFDKNTFTVPATGENSDGIKIEDVLSSIKGTEYEGKVSISNGKIVIDLENRAIVNYTVVGRNKTINGQASSYNNPIIPVGFKAVDTIDATWNTEDGWRNGLVIEDENGNQFVWIPVYDLGGTDKVTYERNSDGSPSNQFTVTAAQSADDTDAIPSGITSIDTQVTKYGDFYVARYEASLPQEMINDMTVDTFADNSSNDRTKDSVTGLYWKPQSKFGGIVWNKVTHNGANAVSQAFVSNSYVKSGLIPGKYWDTMLQFIAQTGVNINDSTDWGNHKDTIGYTITGYYKITHADVPYTFGTYEKIESGYLLLQTGMFGESTGIHPKNLYDIAGNVWEWTAEKVTSKDEGSSTAVGKKIIRGGSYDDIGEINPASSRSGAAWADYKHSIIGFRITLYIL